MDEFKDILLDIIRRLKAVEGLYTTPSVTYTAPTLTNSWVNFGGAYDTAGYYRDMVGFVVLKGSVKDGTTGSSNPIFTLPSGYRPAAQLSFAVASNGAFGEIDIKSNGEVVVITGDNTSVSLDGIRFSV